MHASPGDNLAMGKVSRVPAANPELRDPFASGALVIATLCNPRENSGE